METYTTKTTYVKKFFKTSKNIIFLRFFHILLNSCFFLYLLDFNASQARIHIPRVLSVETYQLELSLQRRIFLVTFLNLVRV